MPPLTKTCRNNPNHTFIITDEDQSFYEKINVPHPTLCPDCRQQRRLAFRNERHLYNRKCDFTQKQIIAMYSPDKPYKVYAPEEWWSDKWDPLKYGRDFDFNRPFFEQFKELMLVVPRIALGLVNTENSNYCNFTGDLKNCYLCFGSIYAEDCYYGSPYYCTNCVDTLVTRDSQFCYECVDCEKVYECFFCQDCYNSNNLLSCYDCQSCHDCIGCAGLRKKEFYIFNEPFSKEEYEKKKKELSLTPSVLKLLKKRFDQIKEKAIRKFSILQKCENCTGNYLTECKNVHDSFYARKGQDAKFLAQTIDVKDSYDVNYMENSELIYDSFGAYREYNNRFCNTVYESSHMTYCDFCMNNCKHCFGCISLKKKEYCILNKQYTKEEYEKLVPRIIEHMKKTPINSVSLREAERRSNPATTGIATSLEDSGLAMTFIVEWGEFFPISISPFGYNETVAHEYFPLSKKEALMLGAKWKDDDITNRYEGPKIVIPEKIQDVQDSITKQILTCETCHKNYKIIPQELHFYKKMELPIPVKCPNCRHYARLALRNPRKLWDRKCMKCGVDIKTSYSPERKEIVYCEECYNKTIY